MVWRIRQTQKPESPANSAPYDSFSRSQYENPGYGRARRELLEHNIDGFDYYGYLFDSLELTGSEKILNVGSGDGMDEVRLAVEYEHQGEIVGLDVPSGQGREEFEVRFLLAEDALAATGKTNVRYEAGFAQHIPFEDNYFDVVMALNMIYHVPDPHVALKEIRRVLRPGGKLLITTNGRENKIEHHQFLQQMASALNSTHPGAFSRNFDIEMLFQTVPLYFRQTKPLFKKSIIKITAEEIRDYTFSLDSYRPSFDPVPDVSRWRQARGEIAERRLQAAVDTFGAFYDFSERGGSIYTNDKRQHKLGGLLGRQL